MISFFLCQLHVEQPLPSPTRIWLIAVATCLVATKVLALQGGSYSTNGTWIPNPGNWLPYYEGPVGNTSFYPCIHDQVCDPYSGGCIHLSPESLRSNDGNPNCPAPDPLFASTSAAASLAPGLSVGLCATLLALISF